MSYHILIKRVIYLYQIFKTEYHHQLDLSLISYLSQKIFNFSHHSEILYSISLLSYHNNYALIPLLVNAAIAISHHQIKVS